MNEKKLILMCDDDKTFLEATSAVLEGSGYEVIVTTTPEQCFEKMKGKKPDLIILDVMMVTDHTGFDVCRDLRRNGETKDIPILMLTAVDRKYPNFSFGSTAGDESWLPVDDFLDKPVEAGVLIEHVRKLLRE
jgi:CheY-like chemotaxis protein